MTDAKKPVLTAEILPKPASAELAELSQSLLTCFQCGTCSASCPAVDAMDVTPRHLWQMIRWGLMDEVLQTRAFWQCTQCYACTVRCPRGIITSEHMRLLRRWVAEEGLELPESVKTLKQTVATAYNISGEDNQRRLIWSENLDPVPESIRPRAGAEVVLFFGCVSSFYPMAYSIPQAMVQILEKAGISYTTMGGEEWCCGYPLYGVGMDDEVVALAKHNVAHFRELGAKRLVTTCPSCYHTWAHIYPELLSEAADIEVVHAAEFLAGLIRDGKLTFREQKPMTVTYHDPCDLGRKGGIYDAPRFVIQSIPGLTLVEMAHHGNDALCCGGGGDVEMVDPQLVTQLAAGRMAEVRETGAQMLVSACQQCKRTLFRAARDTKTRVRVSDLTELVANALA